jgi:hypothetical protein
MALANEFWNNGIIAEYLTEEEGFEDTCFERCIGIIKEHGDAQQAIREDTETSLS